MAMMSQHTGEEWAFCVDQEKSSVHHLNTKQPYVNTRMRVTMSIQFHPLLSGKDCVLEPPRRREAHTERELVT